MFLALYFPSPCKNWLGTGRIINCARGNVTRRSHFRCACSCSKRSFRKRSWRSWRSSSEAAAAACSGVQNVPSIEDLEALWGRRRLAASKVSTMRVCRLVFFARPCLTVVSRFCNARRLCGVSWLRSITGSARSFAARLVCGVPHCCSVEQVGGVLDRDEDSGRRLRTVDMYADSISVCRQLAHMFLEDIHSRRHCESRRRKLYI